MAMSKFDLVETRNFAAELVSRVDRCDNGEGMECANLDDSLRHYAKVCCDYLQGVRQWGRAVFAGQSAFDPEVERIWLDSGFQLYHRSVELLSHGKKVEGDCYTLDGQAILESTLWHMAQLLSNWVTPKLAVGPSARHERNVSPATIDEVQRRIAELPALPSNWQPANSRRRWPFRWLWKKTTA